MVKYVLIGFVLLAGLVLLFKFNPATDAHGSISKELSWTVPDSVTQIRVSSTVGGKVVLNTTLNVTPGQSFKVESVN